MSEQEQACSVSIGRKDDSNEDRDRNQESQQIVRKKTGS